MAQRLLLILVAILILATPLGVSVQRLRSFREIELATRSDPQPIELAFVLDPKLTPALEKFLGGDRLWLLVGTVGLNGGLLDLVGHSRFHAGGKSGGR